MTEALARFLAKRPAVRLQYEHEGSFREYGRRLFQRVPLGQGTRLTRHIVEYARAQVNFGVDERLLRAQLNQYPLVSSADHAGVLHQDILYNANLLFSGLLDLQSLPYQIVLASNRIPLSNASHPRGITFQGHRLNFFSRRHSDVSVWLFDDGLHPDQCQSLETLFHPEGLEGLTREQRDFLRVFFLETINVAQVARTNSLFHHQLIPINNALWRRYFSKRFRMSRPTFLSFPIEHFARELLLEDLENPDSLPYRILFQPEVRSVYLEEFQGIAGCWGEGSGTHFFWGVDDRNRLVALKLDPRGEFLVPTAKTIPGFPLRLEVGSLSEALNQKRIVPSLFFEMLLVAFLEGYTLLGGFNQVNYMAWMRVAHERAMLRLGDWPMAARFARTLTDGLICGPVPFPQWASGFDLLWHFNSTSGKFHGNLDGGLDAADLESMMNRPLRDLIQNGVNSMLQVVD